MVVLLRVLAAIGLLMLGRKLFRLFVGLVGFEAGNVIATRMFSNRSETVILLVTSIIGISGAGLAIFLLYAPNHAKIITTSAKGRQASWGAGAASSILT